MELSLKKTTQIIAALLLLAALSQPVYTALYQFAPDVDRLFIWKIEALIFVLLAAFSGSALVMAKRYTLGFSAIAFAAVLNVIQVGIGLTQFGPFGEAATANPDLGSVAFSVIAYSFFGYNAAKLLLGLAALVFGLAAVHSGARGLGGLTALVGVIALIANAIVMMFGLQGFLPSPIAGGSGVLATLLLAICLSRHSEAG